MGLHGVLGSGLGFPRGLRCACRESRIAFRFGDGVICAVVSAGSAPGVVRITRAQSMLEGVWDTCQKGLGFRYSLSEVAALKHKTMAG